MTTQTAPRPILYDVQIVDYLGPNVSRIIPRTYATVWGATEHADAVQIAQEEIVGYMYEGYSIELSADGMRLLILNRELQPLTVYAQLTPVAA
jgi:hypothetical protein